MKLKAGDVYDAVVEDIAFGGDGVVRIEGMVVFVPFVLRGEKVRIRLHQVSKRLGRGVCEEVLEASPARVRPMCGVFGKCGGCSYQHASYAEQLAIKHKQVSDNLTRIGGLGDIEVLPVVASPQPFGYRNKVVLHGRKGRFGFMDTEGRHVVEVSQCPLASPEVNGKLKEFLRRYRGEEGDFPFRSIPGGEQLSARAFYQTNSAVIPLLIKEVAEMLSGKKDLLVDAYCGAGLFAFEFKERYRRVVGVEAEPKAVEAGRRRIERERIEGVTFVEGRVEEHLYDTLSGADRDRTDVIIDPPRAGCERRVLEVLSALAPARLVYVSCNPATLARDLKELSPVYHIRKVIPVDMFPQTSHVESVALLERK